MKHEVKIPAVGESVTSGLIATWHQQNGGQVKKGDLLITLETDKIAHEITAEADGTLTIISQAGSEVPVGSVVATIDDAASVPAGSGGTAPAPQAEVKAEEKPAGLAPAPAAPDLAAAVAPDVETPEAPPAVAQQESSAPPVQATVAPLPSATTLSVVPAAGLSLPAEGGIVPKSNGEGRVSRRKMSPLRRKIAEHLVAAQHNAAMLTTFNECDMSAVMELRRQLQDSFTKKHGTKLGFMSFFIKAVVDALQAVPAVNARLDGEEIVQQHYFDVGVAVSTEKGLIVPVLRDCDRMSFADIEKGLGSYAEKARSGKIGFEDLQGGVFTISNGGVFGSLLSTPILNPPQCGILGMHAIQQRPVAVDGQVVIRPMMYLAMSYDHRLVDGREAVTFLVRVKECIENPTRLLIGA